MARVVRELSWAVCPRLPIRRVWMASFDEVVITTVVWNTIASEVCLLGRYVFVWSKRKLNSVQI